MAKNFDEDSQVEDEFAEKMILRFARSVIF